MQTNQDWIRKTFVLNLAQAAATYDITTAVGGDVVLNPELCAWYVDTSGTLFTSVSVQTNTANPTVLLTAVEGALANILIGKNLQPAWRQPSIIRSGGKLQFTMIGLTGVGQITLMLSFKPLSSAGGTL